MKLVVTTAHGLEEELCGQARDIATQLGASYVSRKQSNLKKLALQWKAEGVVVVAKQRISCHWHCLLYTSVVPGKADQSYGIHVAALAGLPEEIIAKAQKNLAELEQGETHQIGISRCV